MSLAACHEPSEPARPTGLSSSVLEPSTELSAASTYAASLIPLLPDSLRYYRGAARSTAWDISSKHYVVGASQRSYADPKGSGSCIGYGAFILIGAAPREFFHRPGDGFTSCFAQAIATALNDRLQVIGVVQGGSVDKRVFFWEPGMPYESPRIFPTPAWGGIDDVARDINAKGIIVGHVESAVATHATTWDHLGRAIDIHPPKFHDSKALAINDGGLIAGTADGMVGAWLPSGVFVSTGLPVGVSVERWMGVDRYPVAVNNLNVVTFGSTPAGGGADVAYQWEPLTGAIFRLATPPNDMSGLSSLGRGIGFTRSSPTGPSRGYTRLGTSREALAGIGTWKDHWPNAVNTCGTIVGAIRRGSGMTVPMQAAWWRQPTCD